MAQSYGTRPSLHDRAGTLLVYYIKTKSCLSLCLHFSATTYSTAQMQLHSQARVSSQALEGILKATC